jgi:hypothetical protein
MNFKINLVFALAALSSSSSFATQIMCDGIAKGGLEMPSATIEINAQETKSVFKLLGSDVYVTSFGNGVIGIAAQAGDQQFAAAGSEKFVRADFRNNEGSVQIICRAPVNP